MCFARPARTKIYVLENSISNLRQEGASHVVELRAVAAGVRQSRAVAGPLAGTSTQINRDRDKSWIGSLDLSRVLFIPVVWTWISNSVEKAM